MKKLLILLPLVLATTACKDMKDSAPPPTNKEMVMCIDGVSYVVFKEGRGYRGFGYMSVKLDKDSKVIPCDVEVEIVQ